MPQNGTIYGINHGACIASQRVGGALWGTANGASNDATAKKPNREKTLLDLRLLVQNMLTHDRIVFFHLQLVGHGALVFGRGVIMTGAGARHEFDLFTNCLGHCSAPLLTGYQIFSPRARISASTTSMPFLSIVRSP